MKPHQYSGKMLLKELEDNNGTLISLNNFCDNWMYWYTEKDIPSIRRFLNKHGYSLKKIYDYRITRKGEY
jgi:hypothetical protein